MAGDGRRGLDSLLAKVADRRARSKAEAYGRLLIAVERQPELTVFLPPAGVPLAGEAYPISGVTDPDVRVRVNGQEVAVRRDGSFRTVLRETA